MYGQAIPYACSAYPSCRLCAAGPIAYKVVLRSVRGQNVTLEKAGAGTPAGPGMVRLSCDARRVPVPAAKPIGQLPELQSASSSAAPQVYFDMDGAEFVDYNNKRQIGFWAWYPPNTTFSLTATANTAWGSGPPSPALNLTTPFECVAPAQPCMHALLFPPCPTGTKYR